MTSIRPPLPNKYANNHGNGINMLRLPGNSQTLDEITNQIFGDLMEGKSNSAHNFDELGILDFDRGGKVSLKVLYRTTKYSVCSVYHGLALHILFFRLLFLHIFSRDSFHSLYVWHVFFFLQIILTSSHKRNLKLTKILLLYNSKECYVYATYVYHIEEFKE